MSEHQTQTSQRTNAGSPTPPAPDENANDSYYDSLFTRCGKCHLIQVHDPFYPENHVSCSCFDGAMCCTNGFTNYAKKVLASLDMSEEDAQSCNLFPKMTIQTKLHNLGCINIDHFADPFFARKCSDILLDLMAKRRCKVIIAENSECT